MIVLSHILAVAAVAFVADRLSKWWVAGTFDLHESRPVLPGIFHLTYVENTGAAFSLLTEQTLLLSILSLLVIAGLVWYAPRVRTV
ncbi:MAG TPA: signal peptidase II, partial [Bacillota bacterium]